MNMSMIFGLEDEDPNAEAESQQSENTSSTEDEVEESEECEDDPAEATESFICESLGISPYELDYFASEESYNENVHSLEIGRLKGLADDLGFTKAGREINTRADVKEYRNRNTLFLHTINKKFKSLQDAIKSPEVKRYVKFASDWRCKHKYATAKIADIIKAEPDNFDSKNLVNIDGEVIHITRRTAGTTRYKTNFRTYWFELKIVYIKNSNPDAKPRGLSDNASGFRTWIIKNFDKDYIQTKGFCKVMCDNDDQSIHRRNPNMGFYL